MWLSEGADYESWPLSSVLLTLSIWITVGLGLVSTQHHHPCWRTKRRPHKEVQAVERNTKPPIHITKEGKNEGQELYKRMRIFYLRVMKHGCLEPRNKFHGRNQLQLIPTGPHFHVYFTGLKWICYASWLAPSQLSSWPAWVGLLLIQSFLLMVPTTWGTCLSTPSDSYWSGIERFILVSWACKSKCALGALRVGKSLLCGSLIFGSPIWIILTPHENFLAP